MERFKLLVRVMLDEGFEAKWIAHKIHCDVKTIYRCHPERFRTGRRGKGKARKP